MMIASTIIPEFNNGGLYSSSVRSYANIRRESWCCLSRDWNRGMVESSGTASFGQSDPAKRCTHFESYAVPSIPGPDKLRQWFTQWMRTIRPCGIS